MFSTPDRAAAHDVTLPALKQQAAPEWPRGEVEAHDVIVPLIVTVNTDGRVAAVEVEISVGPDFDAAALRAAAGWTFQPATRDGVAIKTKIRAVARFVGRSTPAPAASPPPTPPAAVTADPPHAHGPNVPHAHGSGAPHTHAPAPANPPPAVPLPLSVQIVGDGPARGASDLVQKRDVLAAAPHRTASDLLAVVPGVFVTQHSGQGKAHQIFLRGFDAVHGQDLEIWVAGAPVNEVSNVHGQGYADMHFVMPEVVKQIRSRPGTYDPRQGDFAVAGSLGFDLGLAEPGVTGALTLGMFGERRVFLAYHPANTPDSTFAAFETQSTDGFGPSRAARRTSAIGQVTYDLGSSTTARVMASTYSARFDSAGVLRLSDVDGGLVDRFATYDPRQGGDSSRSQVVLALGSTDDAEASSWTFAPYFIARHLRLRSNFTGFLENPVEGDSTQQINEAITVGTTGSYRRHLHLLSSDDAIEAGISIRNDWIEQSQLRLAAGNDRTTKTMVKASIRATDVAGYLDAKLIPIRRVVLRGGIRIDGLSYATEDQVEASAGAARTALGAHLGGKATVDVATLPGLHAVASYGDGFRSPQARSLGDGERTPFTKVRSFEGGLRYAEGEQIQASLAVFHTRLSEDLVFDQATARNEPVPATQRTGLAMSLTMRPRPWLTQSGSFTYTRATFSAAGGMYEAGALVPYAPQLVARVDVAATPVIAKVLKRELRGHAGVGLTFIGARPLPFSELGRDIFLADTSLGLRLREVELKLDVYNLLDATWFDGMFTYASNFERGSAAGLVPMRHVTTGAPRTIFGTLSLHL